MFFPRLRRRAKWVFLLLAVAFALAFVVAGVGTGFGSGFGDYLSELFGRQPGTEEPSVEEARERLAKAPNDAGAQLDLANALQADGRTDEAIAAFERYVKLRPKDLDSLQQLAGLYLLDAGDAERRAQAAQIEAQRAFFGNELQPSTSKLGEGLGADPITSFVREETSRQYAEAVTAAREAYRKEAGIWKRLTTLRPDDARFFSELGRSSQQAGDANQAIAAYERYLELSPDATDAAQVRALVKQLKQAQAAETQGAP